MRRTGLFMLAPLVVALPIALFVKAIDVPTFASVGSLWLMVAVFLIVGPESISEVSFGKASIKRDVKAARDARDEVEAVREQLRIVTRAGVENSYILASTGMLAMGGDQKAARRLEANLEVLCKFVEPDPVNENKWWKDVESVFADRHADQGKAEG